MLKQILRFLHIEHDTTPIEYGLIAVAIADGIAMLAQMVGVR